MPENAFRELKDGEDYQPVMSPQKEYPEDHKEIHPVGYNWKHERSARGDSKGKWNAEKSKYARIVADRRTIDGRKKTVNS